MNRIFSRFASTCSTILGKPFVFAAAVFSILLWLASGPRLHFSDTWQLIINTSTTIATFLIAILLQHTQNRDTTAMMLKLDELIMAIPKARNEAIDLEELSDKELKSLYDKMLKSGRVSEEPPPKRRARSSY